MDFLFDTVWWQDHAIEALGLVVGIIYLVLEWRASVYLWIATIIMPIISLEVYFSAGLYADFGINIYYLLMAIYGWIYWTWGNKKKSEAKIDLPITSMPRRTYAHTAGALAVVFFFIAYILINFTNSTVPWLDSFTTAMSIVGTWMLARKYAEQWLAWVIVDFVSTGLYIYKGIYFYAILYAIYTVVAIFGYYKWKRMMTEEERKKCLI